MDGARMTIDATPSWRQCSHTPECGCAMAGSDGWLPAQTGPGAPTSDEGDRWDPATLGEP
jgi:hypothetical protein